MLITDKKCVYSLGAAAPAEIGEFFTPKGVMFVVGNSLFFPIQGLKAWGILEESYYQSRITGEVRRCDLTKLREAGEALCSFELTSKHSFINPKQNNEVILEEHTFDYCYKAVYADVLLESINVMKGTVQVRRAI